MVIIPDRLSDLVAKGEVTPRYYNPGNLFSEVHIVLTNDDRPDPALVQPMVGDAVLTIHNIPTGRALFKRSLGWRPLLLRRWAAIAVDLAREIKPALIRCHGNGLNAFAASEIKRRLAVPYVVSLHGNPDIDYFRGRLGKTWQLKLNGHCIEAVEKHSARNADMVLPVYSPIVPYLKKHGVSKYEVVFNVVGEGAKPKTSYALSDTVKILCVGRQQTDQKDPTNIIRAVAEIPRAHLTLVGDGDLHEGLVSLAASLGISERATFSKAMPNKEILRLMSQSDIFVYASENSEISKGTLEAAIIGLPIVINWKPDGTIASELSNPDAFRLVDGTPAGYKLALNQLIGNDVLRQRYGCTAKAIADARWHPTATESRLVAIYKSFAT